MHKQLNDPRTKKCSENEPALRKLINEKRLKRFDTSTSAPTFTRPKGDCASFAKNRNIPPKFDPEKIEKLECKEEKFPSSSLTSSHSSLGLPETELKASQPSLVSYKIPRKSPTLASTFTAAKNKRTETINIKPTTKSKSPIKSPEKSSESNIARRKFKVPNVPKGSSGILHLLPPEVTRSPVKQTGMDCGGDTSKERMNKDPNPRSITRSTLPKAFNVSDAKTSQRQFGVTIGSASKDLLSKVSNSSSTLNPTVNVRNANDASTFRDFTPKYSSKHRELSCNVEITSIANANDENSFCDVTPSSGQPTQVEPSRPVAVVRPTKIDEHNSRETSHDVEAAKRRKEVCNK